VSVAQTVDGVFDWLDTEEDVRDDTRDVLANGTPATADVGNHAAAETDEARIPYTLLRHPKDASDVQAISDAIFAVSALAKAMENSRDDDDAAVQQGLGGALAVVGNTLELALMNVDFDDQNRIRQAIERPDTDREAMEKRLRGTGHSLWCHPTMPNVYAVADLREL
jgi:hypothetical protein